MEGTLMTSNECHIGPALNHTNSESSIHHSPIATTTALCANLLRTQDRENLDFNPSQKGHQGRVMKAKSAISEASLQMAMDDIECHEAERKTIIHQASMYKERAPTRYPSDESLTPVPTIFADEQYLKDASISPPNSTSSFRCADQRHEPLSAHRSSLTPTRVCMNRDRVRQPPNSSDVSEVGLEEFVEGEMLETEPSDNGIWDQHSFSYPATDFRHARARCSSSTLFDEARPASGNESSWPYHPKQEGPDALNQPQQQQQQQHQPHSRSNHKSSFDQQHKKPAIILDDQKLQQHSGFSQHRNNKKMNEALGVAGKGQMLNGHNSINSSTESPSWTAGTAHLKIEPLTPARATSMQRQRQQENKGNRIEHNAKVSSPMTAPSTPLTPTPTELDKPTKNLMIFNKIPRQWPASQETLHHNFMAKAGKKTPPQVIKDFDSATAERIDRLINKDRPLSRAAKERLAAEQKEIELEARGFFEPAHRWKGRDVYPRSTNWVYCRRTKNNWLEKTKILADIYKLFKGQILGKGHHADVYKGIDMTTGQDLAIKVIYKAVTRRLGFVNEDPMQEVKNRRLLNEAWFIDYLKDGPGICKMIRVVETTTKYYFVMELAQSDLNSYSNGINMREEEIRHILRPIFECLKYAHSHDITHRDIKPENILLRTNKDWLRNSSQSRNRSYSSSRQSSNSNNDKKGSSQGRGRSIRNLDDGSSTLSSTFAYENSYMDKDTTDGRSSMDSSTLHRFDASLADWGLAVEHDCISGRKPVGTPLYAAPEVVRKMKRIRRREWINYRACDIWSLGVTMFVVASGIYPYHTHDALEAQSPPNWSALEASGMSQEYIAFTQRLMNLTAEHRPSAAEACNDPWLQEA